MEPKETERDLDTIRMAYELALQQSNQNGQTVWEVHNIMLLVNTILIGAISFSQNNDLAGKIFVAATSCAGLGLVIVWFFLVKRARKYAEFYLFTAREIEEKYFSEQFDLLKRGGIFAEGDPVNFVINQKTKELRMDRLKIGRVETSSIILTILFAVIYIIRIILIWVT